MCSARRYSGRAGDGDGMLSAEDDTPIKIEAENDRKNGLKNQFRRNPLKVSVRRINLSFSGVPTRILSPSTSMASNLYVVRVKRCSVALSCGADDVHYLHGLHT